MRINYRHSAETIAKISASQKGRPFTSEHLANVRAAMAKRRGLPIHTADYRKQVGATFKGKKLSNNHCAKLSEAAKNRTYSAETRAKMSASAKAYIARVGMAQVLERCKKGRQARAITDELRKAKLSLRRMMHRIGRRSSPEKAITSALGYTAIELQQHLERLFIDGMTWDNHGLRGWHIDHKRPVVSFLRAGITDPRIVHALDNLEPMWAHDNHVKSAKWKAA